MKYLWVFIVFSIAVLSLACSAQQCGRQAGNRRCPNNLCCSQFGYCGRTNEYCCTGFGCQSNCRRCGVRTVGEDVVGDIGGIISKGMFNNILKHRDDDACEGKGFYTYEAFVAAARSFPAFGSTGDDTTRKREIAAFLAQTSHETSGGRPSAPDGPYAWGYCFVKERNPPSKYCDTITPCPKSYYGRGPLQLTWNYNYAQAGRAIGVDLLNNPDLVATDAVTSFKTAIWFWMTAHSSKPSCHDVITGSWRPSASDNSVRHVPDYAVVTNIINGEIEYGKSRNPQVEDRIEFFKRYCQILGVSPGKF
uniref:Hevein-like antimicrobial peptide n=1 Tax=Euonymus europaeus TaxID=123417 RepID=Q7X9R9_EUOEU|nr:hevein-like antimicrobial peptide [Euonymus europaeus]